MRRRRKKNNPAKKVVLALVPIAAICLLVVLFLQCGGGGDDDEATPTPDAVPTTAPSPDVNPMPTPTTVPTSDIEVLPEGVYVSSDSDTIKPGQVGSIDIAANAAGCDIRGCEVRLTFDPAVFQIVDVTPGDLLGPNPLVGIEDIDNQAGTLHYVVAQKGTAGEPASAGTILSVEVKTDLTAERGAYEFALAAVNLTNADFGECAGFEIHNGSIEID